MSIIHCILLRVSAAAATQNYYPCVHCCFCSSCSSVVRQVGRSLRHQAAR